MYIVKTGSQVLCDECIKKGVKLTKSKVNTKYRDKTYDTITVYVPKGEKEKLKEYAKSNGFNSPNEFFNLLIDYAVNKKFSIDDCVTDKINNVHSEDEIPF